MKDIGMHCPLCNSTKLSTVNSYKHHCHICNDCHNVFHVKKQGRYLLEWILPRSLCRRILPERAFLRIFHANGEGGGSDFYSVYADRCRHIGEVKRSEYAQLVATLKAGGVVTEGKTVLDISGGPGYVGQRLSDACRKVIVTEYSEVAAKAMSSVLGIDARKFDYNSDTLQDLLEHKVDVVLIRSSIIFCDHLEQFIASVKEMLNPDGYVLIETIAPTLGEILWWQQMEFTFNQIYSQETLEKLFYKHGFSLMYGRRDYDSYVAVMNRQRTGLSQKLYTFGFEYPLVLLYYLGARKSRVPIQTKLQHSMLTQVWRLGETGRSCERPYENYDIGGANHSTHFGMVYNDYLAG